MNKKQLIIALILCVVLGTAYFFVSDSSVSDISYGKINPFGTEGANSVRKIVIKQGDRELTLKYNQSKWCISDLDNFSADFSKIVSFIRKLTDLKPVDTVEITKQLYGKLGLNPAEKGASTVQVIFYTDNDRLISKLLLGKFHNSRSSGVEQSAVNIPDGRYILSPGCSYPVLINDSLSDIAPDPQYWSSKKWFRFKNIKSISYQSADNKDKWTVARTDAKSKFSVSVKPSDDEVIKPNVISNVSSAFDNFEFDEVVQKSKVKFDKPDTVTLQTFDGFKYKIKVAAQDGNYYLDIAVSADLPKKKTAEKAEKAENDKKDKKDKKSAAESENDALKSRLEFERHLSEWVYKVPSYKVNSFIKSSGDFLKKVDKKKDEK